jgi:hypothetical protein
VNDIPDMDNAYGWDNVMAKKSKEAVKNADNYAYPGMFAGLADLTHSDKGGGHTLARLYEATKVDDMR